MIIRTHHKHRIHPWIIERILCADSSQRRHLLSRQNLQEESTDGSVCGFHSSMITKLGPLVNLLGSVHGFCVTAKFP